MDLTEGLLALDSLHCWHPGLRSETIMMQLLGVMMRQLVGVEGRTDVRAVRWSWWHVFLILLEWWVLTNDTQWRDPALVHDWLGQNRFGLPCLLLISALPMAKISKVVALKSLLDCFVLIVQWLLLVVLWQLLETGGWINRMVVLSGSPIQRRLDLRRLAFNFVHQSI